MRKHVTGHFHEENIVMLNGYLGVTFMSLETDATEQEVEAYFISCFQINALVYYIFLYSSTCFEPYCAHHQEVLLYIHSICFFMYHSSWATVQCTGY